MTATVVPEFLIEVDPVVMPESGTEFYVEFVWWDGKTGHFHISTHSLAETRARDEASVFLRRRWTKVVVCDDMFTCDHS